MFERDLLVACVAFGLGLSMIYASAVNSGWYFENFLIRRVETSRGRPAARRTLGLAGSVIILLGAYTVSSSWIWERDVANPEEQQPASRTVRQ